MFRKSVQLLKLGVKTSIKMNGKDCLLDTNIVIGLFANESSIMEKIKSFSGSIFIPSIVLGELFYGAEQSTRKDENKKKIEELAEASLVL